MVHRQSACRALRQAMERRGSASSDAFTLVELLVVITIMMIMGAIIYPSLNRDSAESDFRSYTRRLAQDMRRARYEAISTREDRVIFLTNSASYNLEAALPGQATRSPLKTAERAPTDVEIVGVLTSAALPGSSYTVPGAGSLPAEIRFTGTNGVQAMAGGAAGTVPPPNSSATIFLRTRDNRFKARIVSFQTTGYTRTFDRW